MAVARVGCVLSPVRTFRDQLYRDRLRRGVGLVPDDVDDPGNLHEAVVRGARREDVRGAGRVVAPVDGHAALRDIDEARPGVHMPPTAGSEPATGGDAGVPRNPLDEEVGISFGLHDRVPELWVLGLDVQGDSAERGLRERLAAEARGGVAGVARTVPRTDPAYAATAATARTRAPIHRLRIALPAFECPSLDGRAFRAITNRRIVVLLPKPKSNAVKSAHIRTLLVLPTWRHYKQATTFLAHCQHTVEKHARQSSNTVL